MGKSRFRSHISIFFLGEYFSDAIRNTLAVVLPVALFFYLGKPETATGIGVGALLISLTDMPDHRANKIRAALYSTVLFFFSALVISSCLEFPHLAAAVLILLAFIFSMFMGLGNRMGLIGTMCLSLCTFVMGLNPGHPLQFACYVLIGSCWYYSLSLIQVIIRPFRSLHHAIFECLISSAAFLRSRAAHYNPAISLAALQSSSIRLHIRVNQRHELIRQLLLTDNVAMNPQNEKGQLLLSQAGLVIDLYEQLSAVHYNYEYVRSVLAPTNVLQLIQQVIECLAVELEALSQDFRRKNNRKPQEDKPQYAILRDQLQHQQQELTASQVKIVDRILSNIDAITEIIAKINSGVANPKKNNIIATEDIAYPLFVTSESQLFIKQFSLSSPVFRFSLRLALSFLFAFILLSFFEPGQYSYWVFLTLLIVSRPRFSLTWKKNIQRVLGTLSGVLLGLMIIYLIKSPVILLSLSVVFLLGFYAFNRLNYALCVGFITAAVIFTLGSYHGHFDHLIKDRVLYTILGCVIAVVASYLFPVWDSRKLEHYIFKAIVAARNYVNVAVERAKGNFADPTQNRMARKNAHLSLVELSDAIGAARLEPVSGAIDFSLLNAIQFGIYEIDALITSIFLSREIPATFPQIEQINFLFSLLSDVSCSENLVTFNRNTEISQTNPDSLSNMEHKLNEIVNLMETLVANVIRFKTSESD